MSYELRSIQNNTVDTDDGTYGSLVVNHLSLINLPDTMSQCHFGDVSLVKSISSIEYEVGGKCKESAIEDSFQNTLLHSSYEMKSVSTPKSKKKKNKTEDFNIGQLYEEMGIATAKCGNISEALCLYDLALNVKRELYADDDEALVTTLLNRARAFREMDLIRSCSQYKEVIELTNKRRSDPSNISFKNDHLFLAQVLIELGHVQCQRGDFDNGILNFKSALNIRIEHFNPDHEEVAIVWYLIGRANHIRREYDEALKAYKRSLEIYYSGSCWKEKNKTIIHSVQRLLTDRTMLANLSTKHWTNNTV